MKGWLPASRRRRSASVMTPKVVRGQAAREVPGDGRIVELEAARLVDVVAALGHRERDDADGGIGEARQHRLGIGRRMQIFDDGADRPTRSGVPSGG